MRSTEPVKLGLGANLPQFALLVLVNALVGAMVGMERAVLPLLAEGEFGLAARSAVLSFIVVFGLTKAAANYFAGTLADRAGRKPLLVGGWLIAAPVPFLLAWAPGWGWILAANVLLGVSQGLTWSATVIMKIDLAGPQRRGLAMGVNEFAGYLAVAVSAWGTGWIAEHFGARPYPFLIGVGLVAIGLPMSLWIVRETRGFARKEAEDSGDSQDRPSPSAVFRRVSWQDRTLSAVTQAGLVNNLNDGMAWGLFPLLFVAAGPGIAEVGVLAAIYPAVWGAGQLLFGPMSDRVGRKPLIVGGMVVQALGIGVVALGKAFVGFAAGAALLGLGTAMVYPTLLAAIGDGTGPSWRASGVGVYRLWRDLGYAAGAVVAGVLADAFGLRAALGAVALLTLASGALVQWRVPSGPVGGQPRSAEASGRATKPPAGQSKRRHRTPKPLEGRSALRSAVHAPRAAISHSALVGSRLLCHLQ